MGTVSYQSLSCVEEVLPWAFAYDHQNYARCLIPFIADMRNLPNSMPDVFKVFMNGEFAVVVARRIKLLRILSIVSIETARQKGDSEIQHKRFGDPEMDAQCLTKKCL